MVHLIIATISYISFFLLEDVAGTVRIALFILFIIAILRFLYEQFEKEKKRQQMLAAYTLKKEKHDVSFMRGIYIQEINNYSPVLPQYTMILFEDEEGCEKNLFTNDNLLLRKIRKQKGEMNIYYENGFIIHIEDL